MRRRRPSPEKDPARCRSTAARAIRGGVERLENLAAPTLIAIPGGEFEMGARESRLRNERPAHPVFVSSFALAACPVTVAEYAVFLAATGASAPRSWGRAGFDLPRQPVTGVSWFDARAYCDWLSPLAATRLHLPTEAQFEWAARGGRDGAFPWGDVPRALTGPLAAPEAVGRDAPNGFGLHNMGDLVHQWCADWYAADYYARSPEIEPRGPESGVRRAARAGSWRHALPFSRCAARSALDPTKRFTDFGFRVAASETFDYVP